MFLKLFFILKLFAYVTSDEQYLSNLIDYYDTILDRSINELTISYSDQEGTCEFFKSCPSNKNGTFLNVFGLDEHFGNLSTNRDVIMVKHSISDISINDKYLSDICSVNEQRNLWKTNADISDEDDGGLIWQYGGNPDGTSFIYPGYNWTSNNQCPGSYRPESRPWYTSGASGQKNIILLIDVSDSSPESETRLSWSKIVAQHFLDSLSYRDFVTIIPYSDYPVPYDDFSLTRANIENVELLDMFVENMVLNEGSSTNIGLAIQAAMDILTSSPESGQSSGCTNTVVLISNGENALNEIDPLSVLHSDTMVFSFIISPTDENPALKTPAILSCKTNGIIKIYVNEFDFYEPVDIYGKYLSSGITNNVVRWSEIYDDSFGLGDIISGSRPIYDEDGNIISVLAIDVLFSNISNNYLISKDDVQNFLVNNQVCEPFIFNEESYELLQDLNICHDIEEEETVDEKEFIKLKPLWITLSVFITVFIYGLISKIIYDNFHHTIGCYLILISLFSLILVLWFLIVFWDLMWPSIVIFNTYKSTVITVENTALNGYRCCDIINCDCVNTVSPSCSSLKSQLIEGTCDNGYHCCKKHCYDCNCQTHCTQSKHGSSCYTTCDRCCDCTKSVNHVKCESACGTCYHATVDVSFVIDGNGDDKESIIHTKLVKSCGRDNIDCANDFIDSHPEIGGSIDAYYDETKPTNLRFDIDISDRVYSVTIIPGLLLFIICCALYYYYI